MTNRTTLSSMAINRLPDWTRSQYFALLLVLTLMLMVYPFWPRDILGLATLDVLLWGVLLASIYAVSHSQTLLRIALLLALPTFLADLAAFILTTSTWLLVSCLLDLAFILFVTSVVIANVMKEERVGTDKIFGAICGYILLGLSWALIYGALELIYPGSFSGSVDPGPAEGPHFAAMDQFIYYSLVTLSTLGYGDITATTHAARSLSSTEAIVGQLYMAILVARLIGLHIIESRMKC
ncbi:MAG: potassium channel family protein [Sedimenticola sp.]